MDEDLLDMSSPAAALDGEAAAGEPGLDASLAQLGALLGPERAPAPLELDLQRLEHLDDEPPRSLAQRLLGGVSVRSTDALGPYAAGAGPRLTFRGVPGVGRLSDPSMPRRARGPSGPACEASLPGAPITQPPGCVPEPHW